MLDGKLERIQKAMEQEMASITLEDVADDIQRYLNLEVNIEGSN